MKPSALFVLPLLLGISGLSSGAQAQTARALPPAGPHRPASVPPNYVITPFGYFHPSCVLQLKKGEYITRDRMVHHADGSEDQVSSCKYPHFSPSGSVGVADPTGSPQNSPAFYHSWVENSNVATNTAYGKEFSTFTVPPVPLIDDQQTIFLFPGFETTTDLQSILQPVLGYNNGQWTIASWNCCLSGTADESSPVNVAAGDTIVGTTQMTCSAGTTSCGAWDITTEDQTTNKSTELPNTPNDGQTFNWAFGGVLEVYNLSQCLDYPPNASLTMNSQIYDSDFNLVSAPGWVDAINLPSNWQPQCDYAVTANGAQTTLNYGTTSPSFGLGITPSAGVAVNQGGTSSGSISITGINGFTGAVNLSLSSPPEGITAALKQGASANSYTLALDADNSAALTGSNQPATITITASASGVATQTFPVNVLVNPPQEGGLGTPVDLANAYNVYGIYSDSSGFPNGNPADSLDGNGDSYSANQLDPSDQTPISLNWQGVKFSLGPSNQQDAVYGSGANPIALPAGKFSTLTILATGVNGGQNSQAVVVTYSDNTSQTFTQTFDDWSASSSCISTNPCAPGETAVVTLPYADSAFSNQTRLNNLYYLYGYSFPLDASKTVSSLTLPNNRNVVLLAATLTSLSTPTVKVTPASMNVTSAQTLAVQVNVSGTSGGATPSGSVVLTSGSYASATTPLSAGTAAFTIPAGSLAAGSDTLTATYTPDTNSSLLYGVATGTTQITVAAVPSFTLSASPTAISVPEGGSATSTINITAVDGFSGAVTLAAEGLPSGVSASFADGSTSGTQVLTIAADTSAAVSSGPVNITVTGTSGTLSAATNVALTITATPAFAGSAGETTSLSVVPGATSGNTGTVAVVGTNGFTGTVSLTCAVTTTMTGASDMPSCSLNPSSISISGTAPQNATLTVTTTAATSAANQGGMPWRLPAGAVLAVMIFCILPARRNWPASAVILLALISLGVMGCGGGSGSGGGGGGNGGGTGSTGTTAGSYTVTVTGTSGSLSVVVDTVGLTVQ